MVIETVISASTPRCVACVRTEVCMGVQSRLPDRTSFRYTSKDDSSAMCCRSSSSSHVSNSGMSGSSQFCTQPAAQVMVDH